MFVYQPLNVCFLVLIENRFYSENEIARRLFEMRYACQTGKIDLLTMDGAISIKYNGEELLGVEFWDVVNRLYISPHQLLEGRKQSEYLSYQTCWLKLSPQGQRLLYELESVARSRTHHIKRSLPLHDFVREWLLMSFRLTKFEAYLGSKRAKEVLEEWREKMPVTEELCRIVGVENIEQIVHSSLENVLSGSGCYQGYAYTPEKGFYRVVQD